MPSYSDFEKLDFRVGTVVAAEKLEKSRNLIKFTIDIGESAPRQILGGMAINYTPEEMVGKKVIVLANLKPKKVMGHESQGMILAADVDNKPILLKLDEKFTDKIKAGSPIR